MSNEHKDINENELVRFTLPLPVELNDWCIVQCKKEGIARNAFIINCINLVRNGQHKIPEQLKRLEDQITQIAEQTTGKKERGSDK